MASVKHDFPFQFLDYKGICALLSHLCDDIKIIIRNTIKRDVLSLYKREKVRLKNLVMSIQNMISLNV